MIVFIMTRDRKIRDRKMKEAEIPKFFCFQSFCRGSFGDGAECDFVAGDIDPVNRLERAGGQKFSELVLMACGEFLLKSCDSERRVR